MFNKGDKVVWDYDQYETFAGMSKNSFKFHEAFGKITRVLRASSCLNCCWGIDWHQSAVCAIEVWWEWPDGSSSLCHHKSKELVLVKRRRR